MNNETSVSRTDNLTDTCNSSADQPKNRDGIADENVAKCGTTASTTMTAPASTTTAATTKELRLENLGRKARERLQNERSKRRVIQRIGFEDITKATDGDESITIAPRKSTRNPQKSMERQGSNCNENSLLVEAAVIVRKRKATTVKARATKTISGIINQRPKRQVRNRLDDDDHHAGVMIDPWIPDISHIHTASETIGVPIQHATGCVVSSTSSNTVQLHGLPIHTTIPQIRSFFTGLQIQRILLLLPYLTEQQNMKETFRIIDLDAKYDDHDRPKDHPRMLERYDANRVRLWVQFPSDAIATCAQLRSGEAIFSTTKSYDDDDDDDDHQQSQPEKGETKQIGATVAISIVPQAMANRMTKLLGIDIMNNSTINTNHTTLEQIIEPIIERIDPQIAMTLWEAVIEEFSFRVHGLISPPPNNQTHRSCWLRIAVTDAELQELQNQRLVWQQEMDRIVQVSSSSLAMMRPENAQANTNHWRRVLLFLLSTTDSTITTITTKNHHNLHHGRGGPTKLTGLLQTAVMQQDDPIIPLTKEYLELLQLYIRRIDTTITMTQRQRLLRRDGP